MLTTRYILDEAHLSHYDEMLKSWASSQPVKTLPSSLYPWTLTDKAGAVTCWPVGGTELRPTVDFLFSETGPASGEKGPENPSIISGVESVKVTRCGKNLLLAVPDDTSWYGISITRQSDGSYLLNGTSTSGQDRFFPLTDCGNLSSGPYATLKLDPAKTYTLFATVVSGTITGAASVSAMNSRNTSWIPGRNMSITGGGTAMATKSASSLVTGEFVCRLNVGSGASFNNVVLQVQLEEGDTATDFEAPMLLADANQDIPLGSTYYGGEIDLATGLMTVTKQYMDINTVDASDGISNNNAVCRYWPRSHNLLEPVNDGNEVCAELPRIVNGSGINRFFVGNMNTGNSQRPIYIVLNPELLDLSGASNPSSPTATEVRSAAISYLSSHPLHMVVTLETPYTVQLSPLSISSLPQPDKYTPRLNTVYTDAQAVQVGYVKSPIREEYELTQAVVAQGGNI